MSLKCFCFLHENFSKELNVLVILHESAELEALLLGKAENNNIATSIPSLELTSNTVNMEKLTTKLCK